jgi:histidyl-tRNA synthetase
METATPTGTFDIIPSDTKEIWRSSYLWNWLEGVIRRHAACYGFEEIRTPIFERTELFTRSVGDSSDIVVSKEMYTFEDKGGRSLSLRPEGTASAIRAFLDKQLYVSAPQSRLYYIGPMFRYERPQLGRFRQHHQFGVEAIGIASPALDAEIIEMSYSLYQKLGLRNVSVNLNSLGDKSTRERFHEGLRDYLRPHFETLSPDSKIRFEMNPLRIFDSKDPRDIEISEKAPKILDFLSPECATHFQEVQKILTLLQVPFRVNPRLVRGLDYYTKTVFEVTAEELGAQNSIGGGGRYDNLIHELGGPDLPAMGFGLGLERILQTMIRQGVPLPVRPRPHLYLIALGESAEKRAISLAHELRGGGLTCLYDMSGKKLGRAMQLASASRAEFALVLGERELQEGYVELKEMDTGKVTRMELIEVPLFFKNRYTSSILDS